jgi:hypothetical protein
MSKSKYRDPIKVDVADKFWDTFPPDETVDWDEEAQELVAEMTERKRRQRHFVQYAIEEGNKYRPATKSTAILPPGIYRISRDNHGHFFAKQSLNTSDIIRFPNTIADNVISEFKTFWSKKDEYKSRGENHKRGFLLWGPPGGGKTCTVSLIMKDFVKQGNVVFEFNDYVVDGLPSFRTIEPDRKVMVVIEDIDNFTKHSDVEQILLQFLDGSTPHVNTIMIATTNYPEELPDRIINRPSRFDRVAYIGFPSEEDRAIYLKKKSKKLTKKQIEKWVKDTDGFTLAHVKELIVSVEVFGLKYENALARLTEMRQKIADSSDYTKRLRGTQNLGFGQ